MSTVPKNLFDDAGPIKNSVLVYLILTSATTASLGFGLHAILYQSTIENFRTAKELATDQAKISQEKYEKKMADFEMESQTLKAQAQEIERSCSRKAKYKEKPEPTPPKIKTAATAIELKTEKVQTNIPPTSTDGIITDIKPQHKEKTIFRVGEYIYFLISYKSTAPEGIQIFAIPNSKTDIGVEFDPSERLVGAGTITRRIRVSKPGIIESIDIKIRGNQGPLLKAKTIPTDYVFVA